MSIDDLAELIRIELEHGTDLDTSVEEKYRHVARCVQDAGWHFVEMNGGAYSAEDVLDIGATITAVIQAASAAMSVLALGQRTDPEEELE